MLLAAHALMDGAAKPRLSIDGSPHEGPYYRRLDEVDLAAAALRIANAGDRPVTAMVTATGIPLNPPPAGGNGYVIERAYYDLDGRGVDPSRVEQGARLVVLLSIRADAPEAARLIVDDPLPAGFEIDNPNLLNAGAIDGLPWLNVVDQPAHVAFRAERFVAALERGSRDPAPDSSSPTSCAPSRPAASCTRPRRWRTCIGRRAARGPAPASPSRSATCTFTSPMVATSCRGWWRHRRPRRGRGPAMAGLMTEALEGPDH
jgi:hypothetical protein